MSILKTLSVGEGDLFYIKHGSSNFTIIDCNMDENNREDIVADLQIDNDSGQQGHVFRPV